MLTQLRSNKYLLFGALGAAGGVAGAVTGEFVRGLQRKMHLSAITSVSLWMGTCSLFIAWGLFLANEIYQRRSPWRKEVTARATLSGFIGGAIAGAIAQNLFEMQREDNVFKDYFLRSFCWGIAGMLLGIALTRAMPNLGVKRTALAGLAGGTVGGFGFILVANSFSETIGRMIGLGILGLALGLAVVIVETLLREASLRIIWAPKEETSVTLGPQTITIGGGDDTVYVAGLPQHAAGIQFKEGQITYTDLRSQQKTVLRNGTKLQIGQVEVIVQAQA